ncbi:ABC-2 transporter permease [Mobilitalea sibirica]|uniref:ABC-2 transporter permease n=1 Tax=Mobilitalea sibirica TaxID=1462919 RepID=A0A8J7H133_9FIRM|nr:ABC-2 transporter permease [Mobilitalea sibirica]MBH1940004.1 ABC-2 transporter permease [Mobilitalea sibirica]
MLGLILKDFINLKKNFKIFGALILLYGFMAFAMESSSYFSSMFTLVFAMLILSTYSYDEMVKWDGYALTMPITKNNIVQGKYITMLMLTVLGFIISGISLVVINTILNVDNLFGGIQVSALGAALVILFYSITIPFITKLGIEKARFIFIIVYMVPFFLGFMGYKAIKEQGLQPPVKLIEFFEFCIDHAYIIIPVIVLIALMLSYSISIRIYQKKEF